MSKKITTKNDKLNKDLPIASIAKLTKILERQNNPWWIFLRGIVYGVGFTVGTVIFASILLSLLLNVLGLFKNNPLIGDWVTSIAQQQAEQGLEL